MSQKPTSAALRVLGVLLAVGIAACSRNPEPGDRSPSLALADTTVCVVSPAAPNGLRLVEAKREVATGRVMLLEDGELIPFEQRYPVSLIAGYAGREGWFTSAEPVTFAGQRYVRTGEMRRVPEDQLVRVGDFRGVLLFSGAGDDPPPDALYVPAEPDCVFQAYVRADLVR